MNLKIYTYKTDRWHLLVHLKQYLGVTTIVEATDDMRPAAERWLARGLNEWVDGDGPLRGRNAGLGSCPRMTEPSSPEFLFRLRDYLKSQFNTFKYEIDVDVFR